MLRRYVPTLVICTAWILNPGSSATAQSLVDVQLAPGNAEAVVRAVARLGREDTLVVRSGDQFEKLVLARCGALDPAYVEAFAHANGIVDGVALANLAPDQPYIFPACVHAPVSAQLTVKKGALLGTLLPANGYKVNLAALDVKTTLAHATGALTAADFGTLVGPSAPAGGASRQRAVSNFSAKANAITFALLNSGASPRSLVPGEQLKLPGQAPVWSTVVLKPGVTAADAQTELIQAAQTDKSATKVSDVVTAELISGIGAFDPGVCPHVDDQWPYSIPALKQALDENRRARPKGAYPRPTTVLVLDTGFDRNLMTPFAIPESRITKVYGPVAPSFVQDNFGVNLATNAFTADPPSDLDNRLHGSEVAVVVLGDRVALETPELKALPVQVAFASVAMPGEGGSVLSGRGVQRALRFAARNDIKVVNISLMANDDQDGFVSALQSDGNAMVIVAAAGNDHHEYGVDAPSWPGSLGGSPGNAKSGNVITVGSHDRVGALSPFSRFGENFVDLLAPGCAVPTYSAGPDGGPAVVPAERVGTSYSAPLVSNAAAQLIAEGFEAPFVKPRILASVDVDEALDGFVYSRGRLNMRKALSVWRDLVEYHDGADDGPIVTRTGEVDRVGSVVRLCHGVYDVKKLMKLAFSQVDVNHDKHAHIWIKTDVAGDPTRFTRKSLCLAGDLGAEKLRFTDAESLLTYDIPLTRLVDFVPRVQN